MQIELKIRGSMTDRLENGVAVDLVCTERRGGIAPETVGVEAYTNGWKEHGQDGEYRQTYR